MSSHDPGDISLLYPNVHPELITAFVKLERAKHHLGELTERVQDHIRMHPVAQTPGELHDNGVFTMPIKVVHLPVYVSAIVGDFFHNNRCSLDHIAAGMARKNGKSDRSVYFPFSKSERDIDEQVRRKNFRKCGKPAVDILKKWKPYNGGNKLLQALHDVDIYDKHRAIVPQLGLAPKMNFDISHGQLRDVKVLKQRYIFSKDLPLAGEDVVESCEAMMEMCKSILESFVALHPID